MAIIIPGVIVFLLFAYLQLNEVGTFATVIIYALMVMTIGISGVLFAKIKKDMKQQQINGIKLEIGKLQRQLQKTQNELKIQTLLRKISKLEDEMEQLL